MSARKSVPATTLQLLAPLIPAGRAAPRVEPHDVIDLTVRTDNKLLLTVEEAADRLGVGRSLMYELLSSGQIDSLHLGRLRRVPLQSLIDYVAILRQQARRPDGAA